MYFRFVDDVKFSHNTANRPESKTTRNAYASSSSPVGGTGGNVSSCLPYVHLRQFDCVSFDNAYTNSRSICSNVSLYYTLALHLAAPRTKSVVYGFILLIFMLAARPASSANRNVTVWSPSVCPCQSVPSAYSPSLTRGNILM